MKLGPSHFVRFSPDGKWLASCGERDLHIQDLGTGKPVFSARLPHVSAGAFSPDSRSLLLKTTSGALYVAGPLDATVDLRRIDAGRGEGAAPIFSSDGRYIVDGSWDGDLVVLEAATGSSVGRRAFPADMLVRLECAARGDEWYVQHSPLARGSAEPPDPDYFTVWSHPLPGNPLRMIRPNLRFVRGSAFSASGDTLALVHGAPPVNLSILDVGTGETHRQTHVEVGGTGGRMTWTPRGLLAVVEEHRVRVYSAELDVLGQLDLAYACDVAFSPSGDLIAIGSWKSGLVRPAAELLD